jgi:hypothetical protein
MKSILNRRNLLGLAVVGFAHLPVTVLAQLADSAEPPLRVEPASSTGVEVSLNDLADNRGGVFAGFHIEMLVEGDLVGTAFGHTEPVITAAVDDTGKNLIKESDEPDNPVGDFDRNSFKNKFVHAKAKLVNPMRTAKSFSVTGFLNFFFRRMIQNQSLPFRGLLQALAPQFQALLFRALA